MNLRQTFFLSGFAFILALTTISISFATDMITPSTAGEPVAYVEVTNAKVVSQKNNTLDISFDFVNGKGLQTGVKYGVMLVMQTSEKKQFIVDEKIYDEALTINENSTVHKDITYVAPAVLTGNYTLILRARNESGFPFGTAVLGDIKLSASTNGIEIVTPSCSYTISGEATRYNISKSVDIGEKETITLTCDAINHSKSTVSVTPLYETRYESSYGSVAPATGGTAVPLSFRPDEKKSISFVLPKGDQPSSYSITVGLTDGTTLSNKISLNYILRGIYTSIYKLSLDKDAYRKGETAHAMYIWASPATQFVRDVKGTSLNPVKLSISATLTNGSGEACAETITEPLITGTPLRPQRELNIPITSRCTDPVLVAMITDESGKVYDQKTFAFETTSNRAGSRTGLLVAIVGISILAIIGAVAYRRKKDTPPTPTLAI